MPRRQRRGRVIAMSAEELSSFLAEQHTCRFATTSPDGPHVAPVWFVWDGQALAPGPEPRRGYSLPPRVGVTASAAEPGAASSAGWKVAREVAT